MKYGHDVIKDGIYYRAGEEIPQSAPSQAKTPEKEVKQPVRKRNNSSK